MPRRKHIYVRRFALVVVTIAIVAMAIIELAVALNIGFMQTLVRKAMWAGSLLWVAIVVISWVEKFKNQDRLPLWCVTIFTTIAAGSVLHHVRSLGKCGAVSHVPLCDRTGISTGVEELCDRASRILRSRSSIRRCLGKFALRKPGHLLRFKKLEFA